MTTCKVGAATVGRVTFGQVKASNPTINFMGNLMDNFNFTICLKTKSKRNALESRALYNSKS
jgi:hypothetical protein